MKTKRRGLLTLLPMCGQPSLGTCWRVSRWIFFLAIAFCSQAARSAEDVGGPVELFKYPARVKLPEDIPSTRTFFAGSRKQPHKVIILPPVIYLHNHYEGWQECLRNVGSKGAAKGVPPINSPVPKSTSIEAEYWQRGRSDGYDSCSDQVGKMIKEGISDDEIRKRCNAAYLPLLAPIEKTGSEKPIKSPFSGARNEDPAGGF